MWHVWLNLPGLEGRVVNQSARFSLLACICLGAARKQFARLLQTRPAAARSLDKALADIIVLAPRDINWQSPQFIKDMFLCRAGADVSMQPQSLGGKDIHDLGKDATEAKLKWVLAAMKDDQREVRMLKRSIDVWDNQEFSSKVRFYEEPRAQCVSP